MAGAFLAAGFFAGAFASVASLATAVLAGAFFAAGFLAGAFFFFVAGAEAARASIKDAASSSVSWSYSIDLGSVALVVPSVT